MTSQGIIMTVGNTSEPMIYSLRNKEEAERPSHILFISDANNGRSIYEMIMPSVNYSPLFEVLWLSDPFDIQKCYEEIRKRSEEWIGQSELKPENARVDFTGGTKAMSGALILAAAELNLNTFEYVSGTDRDPETGRVVSGQYIVALPSPLDTYAVRELERANLLLGHFHADAAAQILSEATEKCAEQVRARIETYAGIANCLARSDRFEFGKKGLYLATNLDEHLARLQLFNYPLYECLVPFVTHWRVISHQTIADNKTPGRETLLELLANAERRAGQFRFDDATARLYRAVELHAQILLKQSFNAELGQPKLEDFPINRYNDVRLILGGPDQNGRYKVSLQNIFRLLELSDDEDIRPQSTVGEALASHLFKRNQSILAHGARPASQDDFQKFWEAILSALQISDSDIPRWPEVEFTLN